MKNPTWTQTPSANKDILTISDIIGIGTNNTPGNTTNSITLQLGNATSGEVYTQDAMLFNSPGLMSLPVPPGTIDINGNFTPSTTSSSGAQAISFMRNDQYIVLGTRDTRLQSNPGNIGPGETCLYGLLGQAAVTCKADSSITLSTTSTGDATGTNIQLTVSPKGLYFVSPFGSLSFDAAGFRVSTINGASFNIMGTSDPTTGNAIMMSAGQVTVSSAMITLGNPETTALPLGVVYTAATPAPGIPAATPPTVVALPMFVSTSVFVGL